MNIGRISLGGGGEKRYVDNTSQLESDISRLVLLVVMLAAVIIGSICTDRANKPVALVENAVKKTLGRSFKASLEGSISMNNETLEEYRLRSRFAPDDGLTKTEVLSSAIPPYDAVSALVFIQQSRNIIEYNPEDMYHHGTRHFSGSIKTSGGDSTVFIFHCWIDMKRRYMIRLEIAGVTRNAGVDKYGEPVSKETYVNIYYFDHGR